MLKLLMALPLSAFLVITTAAVATGETYFNRASEGWYWYEEPPAKPEPEPEVEAPPPAPPPAEVVTIPEPAPDLPEIVPLPPEQAPAPAPPPAGSVEFLREAMPKALDLATNDPTPENVERYLLLQKVALDRSEQFSEMVGQVTTGHPELDEGRRRPRQDAFAKQLEERSEDGKREVLTELFKTNALIMFLDKNCSACGLMGENFFRMQQTHGLIWQAISMDGTVLPPDMAIKQSFDAGLAAKLGVANGGAVFLAAPPNTYIPVTWNPTGGAEIADRILMVARRSGLISEDAFRKTQPVNPMISEANHIASDGLPDILKQADDFLRSTAQHFTTPREAKP